MSLREIAQKLGVTAALVSMALRDKGRVSPKTRSKIKAAAKAMGYHVHPVISKGYSLARQSHTRSYRETLAFIAEYPANEWGTYLREAFSGANKRANELGYVLETFLTSGERANQRQLSRILVARGIRGLIIAPRLERAKPRLYLDWPKFTAVELLRTLWNPRNLHHVGGTEYEQFLEAMHLLKRAGYKRIGMAVEPMQNYHKNGIYSAAHLMLQSKIPVAERIPSLLSFGPWNETTFRRWMKRYQPDILYFHPNIYIGDPKFDNHGPWLENLGLRVPDDISLFCVNVQREEYSGLRRDYAGMGRSAVEMISLLLGTNTLGLVGNPRTWLVESIWHPGRTLRLPIAPYLTKDGFLVR